MLKNIQEGLLFQLPTELRISGFMKHEKKRDACRVSTPHFQSIQMGVIDIRDAVFFLSVIVFFLFANALALDVKKAK